MLQAAGRLALMGFIVCVTLPQAAQATHITCGAMLGPGGVYALDGDVGPCDSREPAITVDSAELDMAGFTVEGSAIHLTGRGSRLTGGVLSGATVILEGRGAHTVEGVQAEAFSVQKGSRDNQLLGNIAMHDPTRSSTVTQGLFRITGDRTTLVGNTARGGRIGFLVFGKSNTLRHNTASGQRVLGSGTTCTYVRGAIGFSVYGAHHTLEGNEASDGSVDPSCLRDRGNIPSGFEIGVDSSLTLPGSDAEEKQERRTTTRVTLEGNTATGYGFGGRGFNAFGRSVSLVRNTARGNVDGFFVVGKNTVEDNEASSNSGSGYLLASGVKAARNVAVDNIGDGFHICCSKAKIRLVDSRAERNGKNGIGIFSADGNLIQRNVVRDNGRDGISVQPNPRPSRRNKVLGNVVSGHSAGFFDLRDEQPCGTNTWTDNTFATKSPECLQ